MNIVREYTKKKAVKFSIK